MIAGDDSPTFDIYPSSVAPYVPTPQSAVERALELAEIGPKDYVLDLGCGDGRAVITAAVKVGSRGLGVELDPVLVGHCRRLAHDRGVARLVEFRCGDIFEVDLPPASVVFLFLRAGTPSQLRTRLERQLIPGTRVAVYKYEVEGWTPIRVEQIDDRYAEPIRLYRM